MDRFTGFGPKALAFFSALKFHQSKEWFDENRALYESDVLDPMVALLSDLTERFRKRRMPLRADGKRSIFRLHRDIRFSKDKSPYKTHAGAVMTRSGDKKEQGLLYIHIDPEGCFAAAGFYMPETDQLGRLRKAIKAKQRGFKTVLGSLEKSRLSLGDFDQLTRVPKGFEDMKDGPLGDMIRLKSFIVEEKLPDKLITTPKLVRAIEDFAGRAMPLLKFGWEALD